MCDEAKLAQWAKSGLTRRQFGVLGAAGMAAACTPASQEPAAASSSPTAGGLPGRAVSFATADGTMDARFIAAPGGSAPAIIHWPDVAGMRASHLQMAQRLAGEGYSVLVVNPYYRDAQGVIWEDFASFADGGWDRAREMRANLSSFAIRSDAKAIVEWLDAQPEVDAARGIGAQGFCMGGPFTVYSAHTVPDRVKAAASFHGGGLVRDDEESPHRLLADTQAAFLFAIAQDDDADEPEHKAALRKALAEAGRSGEAEVYAGDHGWTVLDSPAYAQAAAERAYDASLALYKASL